MGFLLKASFDPHVAPCHLEMFDDRITPGRLRREPHARNGHRAETELQHGVGVPGGETRRKTR